VLPALLHHFLTFTAAHAPHRAALLVREGTLSFGQIAAQSAAMAVRLQRMGLVRGDRVGIMAENCVQLVVVLWAVLRAGGVFVLINPTTKSDKLAYILDDCGASTPGSMTRWARSAKPCPTPRPTSSTTTGGGRPRVSRASWSCAG
jgi:acyl-CoA synthetase (AMP-forming)/AMP-acid ligase II